MRTNGKTSSQYLRFNPQLLKKGIVIVREHLPGRSLHPDCFNPQLLKKGIVMVDHHLHFHKIERCFNPQLLKKGIVIEFYCQIHK